MTKKIHWKRYHSTVIHWALIKMTEADRELDAAVTKDGYIPAQALFCPYYDVLEGVLGSDWGVILNPESVKFGRLVFEHDWCGCPSSPSESGEWFANHGSGEQASSEWALPRDRRKWSEDRHAQQRAEGEALAEAALGRGRDPDPTGEKSIALLQRLRERSQARLQRLRRESR